MNDPPYRSKMRVPMESVLIAHGIELVVLIICADCRLKESRKHMLLLMHRGNDAVLAPHNHGLAAGIAIKDNAYIVLVIDMHFGD
jgi:hypothetical protein